MQEYNRKMMETNMFFNFTVPQKLMDFEIPTLNPENADIAIKYAEGFLEYEPKYISMLDYMDYKSTGNRTRYENPFFEKRRVLGSLLLGEMQENKGRFTRKILDVAYSILQETTWTPSAHNLYIRDTETNMLPDTRRPIIDLFSAETAATLSFAYAVMKPRLTDPEYRFFFQLIEDEIEHRIVKPYLNDHFWWMGDGDSFVNNWCPWCTMNVLLTFFLLPIDDVRRRKAFRQACYSIEHFLSTYGVDGCCNEGAGYYHHAGLCMMNAISIMNQVSGGALQHAFDDEKVRNIASFISDMHVDGDWYINYADCSAKPGRCGVREFLAGRDTHNDAFMAFARNEFYASDVKTRYYQDELNLYFRILAHAYDRDVLEYPEKTLPHKDVYYPSNGVVVAERGRYVFSVKGGDNGDSHNHNDVGSIILYKDGNPVLIDVGVEEYTALTFSERRYEIWTMRSTYHNTLNFEGVEEKAGREFTSRNMDVDFGKEVKVSMDLEDVYGDERIAYYGRSFDFSEDGLGVSESVETDLPEILTFMTREPVEERNGKLLIGKSAEVEFSHPFEKMEIEEFPIDDVKLNVAWGKGSKLYRTRLTFHGSFSWNVE